MAWWDPPAEKRMPTLSGKKGAQIETEIAEFVTWLQERRVRSYLEIGGKYGDTFARIMLALPKDAVGVLVDQPMNNQRRDILSRVFEQVKGARPNTHLLLGNSHDPTIIQQICAYGPYGAALLDGDRTLDGLTADWENFAPLCDLVAFHDIRAAGERLTQNDGTGVPPDMCAPAFFAELISQGYQHQVIADPVEYCGLGVVFNQREVRL